jgi:hypothetical protein
MRAPFEYSTINLEGVASWELMAAIKASRKHKPWQVLRGQKARGSDNAKERRGLMITVVNAPKLAGDSGVRRGDLAESHRHPGVGLQRMNIIYPYVVAPLRITTNSGGRINVALASLD